MRRRYSPAQNRAAEMIVRPIPRNDLQLAVDLWHINQQGYLLSLDGNDKLAATIANLRSADSSGTYEITGLKSTSTANDQTLIASCDTGTTTTFFHIYVAATTGRLTISTRENNGTVNTVSGTTNVCTGARIPTMQVKSSGTAWSFVINGVLDTPIVVAGSNTGDWLADIGLVAPRDNVTHGVKTTTGDGSWAIAEMAQHRLYSVAISDAECATNNSRGWKSTPFDETYVVYNLPCQEGTGNPVETVAAVNPTLTGATWIEGLTDRSPNALALSSFGSPTWGNTGRTLVAASSQYISAGNPTQLNFGTGDFTLILWAKMTGVAATRTLINKGIHSGVSAGYWLFTTATPGVTMYLTDGAVDCEAISTINVFDGLFHHFVGIRDGTSVRVYIDLVLGGSDTQAGFGNTDSAYDFQLGRRTTGTPTGNGIYGEPRGYNRVLSLAELTQDRNGTKWRYV